MSPDDYLDDDEPRLASRSIFATGWFRALLVLVVLGVVLVFAVPYALQWLEPAPPPRRQVARPEPAPVSPSPAAPVVPATPAPPLAPTAVEPPKPTPPAAPAAKAAPAIPAPPPRVADAPAPKGEGLTPPPARTDRPLLGTGPARPAPKDTAAPKEARRETRKEAQPVERPAPAVAPETTAPARRREVAARSTPSARSATARGTSPRGEGRKAAAPEGGSGDFWVQVGAFQDEKNAERLAASLREGRLAVEVTRVTRGGAAPADGATSQHQVFVAGASVETVSTALRGSGKAAQAAPGGVLVQPALPMREAVELSQKLKAEGLTATIRRIGGAAGAASGAGGQVFHVVRAGGYPTRAAAAAARQAIEARGIPGFIARGAAK